MTTLENIEEQIRGRLNGLMIIVDAFPEFSDLPELIWDQDHESFLDTALTLGARLLYLHKVRYDPDSEINDLIGIDEELDDLEAVEDSDEAGVATWYKERYEEALAPWKLRTGETMRLTAAWVYDGIAHIWSVEADWTAEQQTALNFARAEVARVEREDRVSRLRESFLELQNCAKLLASHSRFPEANSQEKREFMAERIFGSERGQAALPFGVSHATIARFASLYYWWEVAPEQEASLAQRVRELRDRGTSIRNIAAAVRISEARVRALDARSD